MYVVSQDTGDTFSLRGNRWSRTRRPRHTQLAAFPEPPEALHDSDGPLQAVPGLHPAGARVRGWEVSVSAQPILKERGGRGHDAGTAHLFRCTTDVLPPVVQSSLRGI